ncbi:uncharacterized protein [Amphiura filiformis]|uniref:uncharacterized protein n=1 Tax=Amphiura filiformis TaxID=82378 RepID=UPI003B20EE74
MGPITFLAMINYALNDVQHTNRVWKYVDDLTIGENRAYSDDSAIQENLDVLNEWSKSNKLKLNPSKCQAMQVYFGKKATPHVDLSIDDHKLAVVEKVKLLGVMIQNNLCWDEQVDSMYAKANRKLFMLRKLKEASLSPEELLLVYKGYIRPVLEYAAPLWHSGLTHNQVAQLEKIQRRVCKYILGRKYTTYADSLATLELHSLSERRQNICKEFALKASTSVRFSHWFPPSKYHSHMTLRRQPKFDSFRCRTNRFQNSPLPFLTNILKAM